MRLRLIIRRFLAQIFMVSLVYLVAFLTSIISAHLLRITGLLWLAAIPAALYLTALIVFGLLRAKRSLAETEEKIEAIRRMQP